MSTTYIPGVCNIGPAEIKLRKLSGTVGLSVTIVLFMVLLVSNLSPFWRWILFIPATIGAAGYLQAKLHFCVRFGTTGLFNVSSGLDKRETVEMPSIVRKISVKPSLSRVYRWRSALRSPDSSFFSPKTYPDKV
jgi:hypothetical protein